MEQRKLIRKVRFTLPHPNENLVTNRTQIIPQSPSLSQRSKSIVEIPTEQFKIGQLHGTSRYVNGMLITAPIPQTSPLNKNQKEIVHNNQVKCEALPQSQSQQLPTIPLRSCVTPKTINIDLGIVINGEPSSTLSSNNVDCEKKRFFTLTRSRSPVKINKKFTPSVENLTTTKNNKMEKIKKTSSRFSFKNKSTDDLLDLLKTDDDGDYSSGGGGVNSDELTTSNYSVHNKLKTSKFRSTSSSLPMIKSGKTKIPKKSKYFNFNYIKQKRAKTKQTTDYNHNKKERKLFRKYENFGHFLTVPPKTIEESTTADEIENEIDYRKEEEKLISVETNHKQLLNFINRWSLCNIRESTLQSSQQSVPSNSQYGSDVKRSLLKKPFRSLKMSLEKIPVVTTLLRASRDANEILLKSCIDDIMMIGISRDDLNMTDLNGRTAISYICSTNLINILDELLRMPDIDVNKPDNEGNTPLHFAAQAGLCEIINMILTRSRSVKVDAKNNLGFTPLMKACIQGRTKCAKLLLFAGASPVEVDTGRQLRAEQWARFCGRYSCAEMIEKCARTRLLSKSASCRLPNEQSQTAQQKSSEKVPIFRSKSNSNTVPSSTNQGTIRSKFRKVFPFGFSFLDNTSSKSNSSSSSINSNSHNSKSSSKSNSNKNNCPTELVTYLTAAALCASGPVLPSNTKSTIIKSLIRPLEVPKLEVTPANNQALIKKYENAKYSETEPPEKSPTPPPRWKNK